jgi:hypothetical protein
MLIIFFPGIILAIGLWLLLHLTPNKAIVADQHRGRPRRLWFGVGMLSLIPLFFLGLWLYTISHIALAKNEGVYPTPQDAIVAKLSRGWGGAEVVKLEMIHATPNMRDGSLPRVWFGGARVYLDRIPAGGTRDTYSAGSYYVRVEDGWVHMSEGTFPELIGWAMELFNLESADR